METPLNLLITKFLQEAMLVVNDVEVRDNPAELRKMADELAGINLRITRRFSVWQGRLNAQAFGR